MKHIFTLILCMILALAMPCTVFSESSDPEMTPDVYEVCNGLPYHDMISRGIGNVYLADGTHYITNGSCWQCSGCNLVMVTEGDIIFGQMTTIGRWATYMFNEPINNYGCTIRIPNSYGYSSSTSMNGYRFSLAG